MYIIYAGKSNTNVIGFVRYIYMYMLLHIYVYFQAYMCIYIYTYMLENKDNTVVFFLSGGVGKEGRMYITDLR